MGCLRYCKSTIFQANHNLKLICKKWIIVVCDTAKVRFFKQITTEIMQKARPHKLFAILQKYDFSSKSQHFPWFFNRLPRCLRYCKSTIFQANHNNYNSNEELVEVVCDTAKVRFFKQITTARSMFSLKAQLFAILQKYDFSSKSQRGFRTNPKSNCCLRYCKSTIFQANHNIRHCWNYWLLLFAILQKYDFSSKSQQRRREEEYRESCLRYCKSTIFQANHNKIEQLKINPHVVCDTAKVRFFKQITTKIMLSNQNSRLFAILQKYDFSSKSQRSLQHWEGIWVVCDTAKVRFFKQITTLVFNCYG